MRVFIVGMRRCGTTILFDCFYEDRRFNSYYEPFCHGRINIGGGSGARKIPYGKKLNDIRREFIKKKELGVNTEYFNYGAPSDYRKELTEELPEIIKEYIQYLCLNSEYTLLKFVRLYNKLKTIHEIIPDAKIIHIVKDPRRAVMSHLFIGNRDRFNSIQRTKIGFKQWYIRKRFFTHKTDYNFWSSERIINAIIKDNKLLRPYLNSPSYEKLMLLWKVIYDKTRQDGLRYFGEDYLEIKHENLCHHPNDTLEQIYRFLNLSCPDSVINWARENVKPPRPIFQKDDHRWYETANKMGIEID